MASIQFFTRNSKNPTKIAIRMYVSRNNQPYTTLNILVNGKLWSKAKQRLKGHGEYTTWVNQTLEDLNAKLLKQFSIDYTQGKIIDSLWLEDTVSEIFKQPKKQEKLISELLLDFVKENPIIKGKQLSKGTLKNYEQESSIIKKFKDVPPAKIDVKYHHDFIQFLKKEEYAPNTISKKIAVLKSFLKKAKKLYGTTIHESVYSEDFFIPPEIEVDNVYLREDTGDIDKIIKIKLPKELEPSRANFILGIRTGLRVSDFLDLHEYNIQGDFLEVQTKKTDNKVIIPIHPDVRDILMRYGGLPPSVKDYVFNKEIKEICQLAGLDTPTYGSKTTVVDGVRRKRFGKYPFYELVTSHICRRSFATNLYGKLPNLTIMAITGHKSEKSFLKYIKTTSKEHAQRLKEFWES